MGLVARSAPRVAADERFGSDTGCSHTSQERPTSRNSSRPQRPRQDFYYYSEVERSRRANPNRTPTTSSAKHNFAKTSPYSV